MTPDVVNRLEYKLTDLGLKIPPECELIHEYLEDALLIGKQALEVGPGNGRVMSYLLSQGMHVDVIEVDGEVIEILQTNLDSNNISRDNWTVKQEDISELELKPDAYSLISVSHVLHFLPLDKILNVLNKLRSALSIGGILIFRGHSVNDPHASQEIDYVKHYFRSSDFDWFKQNGFSTMYFSEVRCKTSMRCARFRATAEGRPMEYGHYSGTEQVYYEAIFRRDQ